jgi:hypothetical protein
MGLYGCVYGFVWMCVYGYVFMAMCMDIGSRSFARPDSSMSGLTSPWGPFLLPLGLTPSRGPFQQILGLTPPRGPFLLSLGLTPSRGPFQQIFGTYSSTRPISTKPWDLLLHEAHFSKYRDLLLYEAHLDDSSNFSNFSSTKMEKFAPVCSVE